VGVEQPAGVDLTLEHREVAFRDPTLRPRTLDERTSPLAERASVGRVLRETCDRGSELVWMALLDRRHHLIGIDST
jgi:hypothetical protein